MCPGSSCKTQQGRPAALTGSRSAPGSLTAPPRKNYTHTTGQSHAGWVLTPLDTLSPPFPSTLSPSPFFPQNPALPAKRLNPTQANLMEAERQGLAHPEVFADTTGAAAAGSTANGSVKLLTAAPAAAAAAGGGSNADGGSSKEGAAEDAEPEGQEIDLAFPVGGWLKEGTYNLQLVVMSDCWVGADESMPVSGRVCACVCVGRLFFRQGWWCMWMRRVWCVCVGGGVQA